MTNLSNAESTSRLSIALSDTFASERWLGGRIHCDEGSRRGEDGHRTRTDATAFSLRLTIFKLTCFSSSPILTPGINSGQETEYACIARIAVALLEIKERVLSTYPRILKGIVLGDLNTAIYCLSRQFVHLQDGTVNGAPAEKHETQSAQHLTIAVGRKRNVRDEVSRSLTPPQPEE